MTDEPENDNTPIERPLLRSDLNDVREIVHRMDQMLVTWYEENKGWRAQSDETRAEVRDIKRRLWLPVLISTVMAALAVLSRIAP